MNFKLLWIKASAKYINANVSFSNRHAMRSEGYISDDVVYL